MDFTLSCVYRVVPLYERVAVNGSLICALLLGALFFRWGLTGRPMSKAALVLAVTPWMLGTLGTAWSWFHLQDFAALTGAGTLSHPTYLIGIAEALRLQAATAGFSALLLCSLAGVLALEARTRRPGRDNLGLLCFALSLLFTALSAGTKAAFLAHRGAEGLAWSGLTIGPWTWLLLAQLALAAVALVIVGAKARVAPRNGPQVRALLVATLVVLGHSAQLCAERWVFSGFSEQIAARSPRPP